MKKSRKGFFKGRPLLLWQKKKNVTYRDPIGQSADDPDTQESLISRSQTSLHSSHTRHSPGSAGGSFRRFLSPSQSSSHPRGSLSSIRGVGRTPSPPLIASLRFEMPTSASLDLNRLEGIEDMDASP